MSFQALEQQLELPRGLFSAVLDQGMEAHYSKLTVSPKTQLISRKARLPKKRTVFAPSDNLKFIQRAIARIISDRFNPHPVAHAYTNGRSIFTNAIQHVRAHSILKIDLVDFFRSIGRTSVFNALMPILGDFSTSEIELITHLSCYQGFLPQGAPASPILSNLVCYALDMQLDRLAKEHGCRVTRFSDDITFSTMARHFPRSLAHVSRCQSEYKVALASPIHGLLRRHGFLSNPSKLKFHSRPQSLKITGLIVGERIRVPKEFLRNLRAGLHQWEHLGLDACARTYSSGCVITFANSLRGSIEFIGQAQGRDCDHYQRALSAFKALQSRDRTELLVA